MASADSSLRKLDRGEKKQEQGKTEEARENRRCFVNFEGRNLNDKFGNVDIIF